jgi:hypothetical protein
MRIVFCFALTASLFAQPNPRAPDAQSPKGKTTRDKSQSTPKPSPRMEAAPSKPSNAAAPAPFATENKKTTAEDKHAFQNPTGPPIADDRLADYTKNLADYTRLLAIATVVLIAVGILQALALFCQARILSHHSQSLRRSVIQMRRSVAAYRRYGDLTKESNEITQDATDLTRQSVLLTHRPKLIVRRVSVNGGISGFRAGGRADGKLRIINAGGTTAISMRVEVTAIVSGNLPMKPVYAEQEGIPLHGELAPGASVECKFRKDDGALNQGEASVVTNPHQDERRFYVLGFVTYLDRGEPPITRCTYFCRMYDPDTNRFRAVTDPDYECAD